MCILDAPRFDLAASTLAVRHESLWIPDRGQHNATDTQLLKPQRWNVGTGRCAKHRVERRAARSPVCSITEQKSQIRKTQRTKVGSCELMQSANSFNAVDLSCNPAQNGRLIAAARPDFQNAIGSSAQTLQQH